MPKNREIIRAIGTCEISNLLAEVMFQKNINVPNDFILSVKKVISGCGDYATSYAIYFNHPIMDLSLTTGNTNHYIKNISIERTVKDFFKCSRIETSLREMMETVNLKIQSLKGEIKIHRTLEFEKYSDLSEETIEDIYYDDKGNLDEPIGFDRVFINIAAKYGINQKELENSFVKEIKKIKEEIHADSGNHSETIKTIMEMKFHNKSPEGKITSNDKILSGPLYDKMPKFSGWLSYYKNPIVITIMIGNWFYCSTTPYLSAKIILPETMKNHLKGRPVNDLLNEPIFGENQKIDSIDEYDGKTYISITREVVPLSSIK